MAVTGKRNSLSNLDRVERFRQACAAGRNADLADYLPPPSAPQRGQVLHDLLLVDWEFRCKRREPISLEAACRRFPELGEPATLPPTLILEEYRIRSDHGDRPTLESYRKRFPRQYEALVRLNDEQSHSPTGFPTPHCGTLLPLQPDASAPPASLPPPRPSVPRPPSNNPRVVANSPPGSGSAQPLTMPTGLGPAPARTPGPNRPPPSGPKLVATPTGSGSTRPLTANSPPSQSNGPRSAANLPTGSGGRQPPSDVTTGGDGPLGNRDYVLGPRIGGGNFGDVYRGLAPGGVPVAIKILRDTLDEESSKRERAALEAMRSLNYPYLMHTQAFWVENGRLVVVMDLADDSMYDWFKQCRRAGLPGIPGPELAEFIFHAGQALDYLQGMGIYHRDIKPENLLRVQGFPKVADFGLAKERAAHLPAQTFCGTPGYMAPECWNNQFGDMSDQYSLAATYAHMRTGEFIFEPTGGLLQLAGRCQREEPNLCSASEPEQKVLRRALAKNPNDRFPSCTAFAEALRDAFHPRHDYRLLELIGEGEFARVYRAEAPGGIEVAVKITKKTLADDECQRELQALELIRNLNHPHLLNTFAFWKDPDGRLQIVMLKADESLVDWQKRCRGPGKPGIPIPELRKFFREAAEALDFLHENGRIHRDVKPANLLRLQGHAKVADFGLVRSQDVDLQDGASICGTPAYMPPEVWERQCSVHCDQYSLAIAYAESRTGHRVFTDQQTWALWRQHKSAAPNLKGLLRHERKAVKRALAKQPAKRFPNCVAFVDALDRRRSWHALAVMMLLLLLIGLLLKIARDYVKPAVDLPPGFTAASEVEGKEPELVTIGDKRYPVALNRELPGGESMKFVLIRPSKNRPGNWFYISRDKVTIGQFKAVWDKLPKGEKPEVVPRPWDKPGDDPNLPVTNVTVTDAHLFAQRLDKDCCNLPTGEQWEQAAVASDNYEWTRDVEKNSKVLQVPIDDPDGAFVMVRSEASQKPFRQPYLQPEDYIGFRVVLEIPNE